jgi:type I restriction enzyme S subunit
MVPPQLAGANIARQAGLIPLSHNVDPKYVEYFLRSPQGQQALGLYVMGAVQQVINLADLKRVEVPIPPLDVQQRISSTLFTYDHLIETNTQRIAILVQMARRIFAEWFVCFRAPGCETLRKIETSMGPIPEGWRLVRGAELFQVNPEQISPRDAPDVIRYIDIASVSPGVIETVTAVRFVDAPSRARRIVRHGDTIWSCVRPNRRSFALIVDPDEHTIVSTGFAVLRSRELPFAFIYSLTTTNEFAAYLTNHTTGAAYPAVKAEDFEKAEVILPPCR